MIVKKEMLCVKRVIVLLFFFFTCCNALSSSSSESNLTSEAVEYKHLGKQKQHTIKYGRGRQVMKLRREVEPRSKELKRLHEVLHLGINNQSKKANRGVYGGGDLLRSRSKKGGASSLNLKTSCSSVAFKTLALGLLFFVFF